MRFGLFDALIGGDLSGARTSSYRDVETPAAAGMSQVELYKVHHHGSQHSSNAAWLAATAPMVGIISAGPGNVHGHPTTEALSRLHAANVRTYWTTAGSGAAQPVAGRDVVGGDIIVEVAPGSPAFTVRSISPANLAQGAAPPAGKRLHAQCPRQPGGNP